MSYFKVWTLLIYSALQTKTDICANSIDPDEMACIIMSSFIRIYMVCHSTYHFNLKPLFSSVDKSKFKDGRVHFRNSGMKGLKACLRYEYFSDVWNNRSQWSMILVNFKYKPHFIITKTSLFKYIQNFTYKNWKFSDKKLIFFMSAQNIDRGYSFEPPHRGSSNEYSQSMFLSRNKNNV